MPGGVDYVDLYDAANRVRLPREPTWAASRDQLYGQQQRQQQRQAAVSAVWGSLADVWADVLHNTGRGRFIPGYVVFLSFS